MPSINLNLARRRKGAVHFFTPAKPQELRLYTNWDQAEAAPTVTIPWPESSVPGDIHSTDSTIYRVRGKWAKQINPVTYGLSDTETFYARLVLDGGTVEQQIAIVPVSCQDVPVEIRRGTVTTTAVWVPFGRSSQGVVLVNMGTGGTTLLFRVEDSNQWIELPPGNGWSEDTNLAGVWLKASGGSGSTVVQMTVTLVSGGA